METKLFKWKDLSMKWKFITGGGFASLLIAISLCIFMLSCSYTIYEYQIDALDEAVASFEQDAITCIPHDPRYRDFDQVEIDSSVRKRLKKYQDTKNLLKAIRNQGEVK